MLDALTIFDESQDQRFSIRSAHQLLQSKTLETVPKKKLNPSLRLRQENLNQITTVGCVQYF